MCLGALALGVHQACTNGMDRTELSRQLVVDGYGSSWVAWETLTSARFSANRASFCPPPSTMASRKRTLSAHSDNGTITKRHKDAEGHDPGIVDLMDVEPIESG